MAYPPRQLDKGPDFQTSPQVEAPRPRDPAAGSLGARSSHLLGIQAAGTALAWAGHLPCQTLLSGSCVDRVGTWSGLAPVLDLVRDMSAPGRRPAYADRTSYVLSNKASRRSPVRQTRPKPVPAQYSLGCPARRTHSSCRTRPVSEVPCHPNRVPRSRRLHRSAAACRAGRSLFVAVDDASPERYAAVAAAASPDQEGRC